MTGFGPHQNKADNPFMVPRQDRLDYRGFIQEQMQLSNTDTTWAAACETLQRTAHGFPARFGSAFAHQIATPAAERIDPREAPFSAFIFVDDPEDSNKDGHVVGKWHDAADVADIVVVSNDVGDDKLSYDPGNVTTVSLGFFPEHWGDTVQYATLWFGPQHIATVDGPPEPTAKQAIKDELHDAIDSAQEVIEMMEKAIHDLGDDHPIAERRCRREISHQRRVIDNLKRLLS